MRLLGCIFLGLAAGFLAHGLGIPAWITSGMGGPADIGVLTGVGLYLIMPGAKP